MKTRRVIVLCTLLAMASLVSCSSEGSRAAKDATGTDTTRTDTTKIDTTETDTSKADTADNDTASRADTASKVITLSGKLVAGDQGSAPSSAPGIPVSAPAPGAPLVGYQLYCVTFAEPPTAGKGTADEAGLVSLSLDALGVAFGCFVLDTLGKGVATLLFSSGTELGQTVTLTGDTELGSITVDLNNGVAKTTVDSSEALTGSTGLTCPLGGWVATVPKTGKCGDTHGTVWFAKTPEETYTASFTAGPLYQSDIDECIYNSKSDLPAIVEGNTFSFQYQHDPFHCPSRMATLASTPNEACTELVIKHTYGPCASCEQDQCGCEEGSLVCEQQFTAVRE